MISEDEINRLTSQNEELRRKYRSSVRYIRDKVDQLLTVMGTSPLKPEELDDETLIEVDPIGIVGNSFVRIIRHLNRTNEKMKIANDEIKAIFESTGLGILVIDRDMRVLEYNTLLREYFFDDASSIIGQPCYKLICQGEDPNDCPFMNIFQTGKSVHQEKWPLHDRYYNVVGTPVMHNDSEITMAVVVYMDITELIRKDEELRESEERIKRYSRELERSNRELDNFASIAAHDLSAPLRAVSGFAGLLRKHYKEKLDADADHYISQIVEGTGRMQRLINDLLEYARAGTHEKTLVPANVNTIIEKTLVNLTFEVQESGAVITVDPLPTVSADRTQLIQLFQNLVGNAIKYRSNTPRIHIAAERKDGEWLFRISDNGIGIDPQQFDRIFQIFQRLHTSSEYSGTGIGLAICKKIVDRLGGRIWVESKPGEGSTFFFTLPLTDS